MTVYLVIASKLSATAKILASKGIFLHKSIPILFPFHHEAPPNL
ncbi:MAG: hypothetical protein V2A53_10165 [bacterium]